MHYYYYYYYYYYCKQQRTEKMKTDLNVCNGDGDCEGDNLWHKQRPLNTILRSFTVFTSSSFKMWGNLIWKTLDVLLRVYLGTNPGEEVVSSPLFTSSSLILLEFVVEFWSVHHNLLCSVYLLVVVLHRNRETIMSLTIICHSTSVFLANVWNILIAPRSAEENPRNPRKYRCYINNHNMLIPVGHLLPVWKTRVARTY